MHGMKNFINLLKILLCCGADGILCIYETAIICGQLYISLNPPLIVFFVTGICYQPETYKETPNWTFIEVSVSFEVYLIGSSHQSGDVLQQIIETKLWIVLIA